MASIKINSKKTGILEKASWEDFKYRKNKTVIFDRIEGLIVPYFTQN